MYPYNPIVLGGVMGGLSDAIKEVVKNLLEGMFEIFFYLCNFKELIVEDYGILPKIAKDAAGHWTTIPGVISPLIEIAASFGAVFALLFLIVNMIDTYIQEKMSIETFAKPFIIFIGVIGLMANAERLVAYFWNFGVLFENQIANVDVADLARSVTVNFDSTVGVGAMMGFFFASILLFAIILLFGILINICARVANFSRMIEAAIRGVGMPIALGLSVDSNFKQGAFRYIKKFLAVALQGGIFVAIGIIFTSASAAVMTSAFDTIAGIDDTVIETVATSLDATFKWNEATKQYMYTVVDATGLATTASLEAALNLTGGLTIAAFIIMLISTILPLVGLALGSIVVLFKSGQICNDIVGA